LIIISYNINLILSNLKALDEAMNERFSSIEKVISRGNSIIVEFPAASKVIQVCV
jgi:hypothetical protein